MSTVLAYVGRNLRLFSRDPLGVFFALLASTLLAGRAEDDHPFALKYRLFERGRWPVALIGSSLHLF